MKNWLPVDQYVGGQDHATMHLLYARFVCMALNDAGLLHFDEPFTNLYHQGVITNGGKKMSKSKDNVVSPDPFIEKYGSDTFRMYLMFMGPYDEGGDWSDTGILGIYRFLNRVWRLCRKEVDLSKGDIGDDKLKYSMNITIKSVSEDLQEMHFNTAISRIMEFVNDLYKAVEINQEQLNTLMLLLAPFAPHLTEELWEFSGNSDRIFIHPWPEWDDKYIQKESTSIAVQVLGKLRGSFEIEVDSRDEEVIDRALEIENVRKHIEGKEVIKNIVIKNKLVNFVVK